MKVQLTCDPNNFFQLVKKQVDSCNIVLSYSSKEGCGTPNGDKIYRFLGQYQKLWGLFLILFGLLIAVIGAKLVKPMLFLCTSLLVVGAGYYFSLKLLHSFGYTELTNAHIFGILIGWGCVGVCLGCCVVSLQEIGVALLAGLAGYLLGHQLAIVFKIQNETAFQAVCVGCGAATFIIACMI